MWGVPTHGNEAPCTITITAVRAKLGHLMKSSKEKTDGQKADIISPISFFQKEKQDIVKLHSTACSEKRHVQCGKYQYTCNLPYSRAHGHASHLLFRV